MGSAGERGRGRVLQDLQVGREEATNVSVLPEIFGLHHALCSIQFRSLVLSPFFLLVSRF